MAMTNRFQLVIPFAVADDMDVWLVRIEAISIADMARRSIHLLARMVEAGADVRREPPGTGRTTRIQVMLTDLALIRLKRVSEEIGLNLSQTLVIAYLWYRDAGEARLEGRPLPIAARDGEIDCTALLQP